MKALKANRIISIEPKRKDEFLANGYTILDDNEKVIAAPEKDATKVGKELDDAKKQLAKKDEEIARLNAMIVDLQQKLAEAEDAAAPDKDAKKAAAKK